MKLSILHHKERVFGEIIAPRYSEAYNTLFYRQNRFLIATKILEKFDAKPINILDVGCGPGNLSYAIRRVVKSEHIYGIDVSEVMLKQNYHFRTTKSICGVIERMPFKDETFDVVAGFSILHHLGNLTKGFKEIIRVLKVGGLFIFGEPIEPLKLSLWKSRLLYGPYSLLGRIFMAKNKKELMVFGEVNFDNYTTEVHKPIRLEELTDLKGDFPITLDFKRSGVITSFLGTKMYHEKWFDKITFMVLWHLDYVYSKFFKRLCQEVIISGEKGND